MKLGICALVKNENLYLREWVKYHIELGFDKIIIYDNNPVGGEDVSKVILDYIDMGYVEIHKLEIDINNIDELNNIQTETYNKCLDEHKELDWIAFIDVDEFIELEHHAGIKDLFGEYNNYEGYDNIVMCWYAMGDPNSLYYDEHPVFERFKTHLTGAYGWENGEPLSINGFVKSFVHPQSDARFDGFIHCTNAKHACVPDGRIAYTDSRTTRLLGECHEVMRLNHYYTKSLTEYLYRCQSNKHKGNFEYAKYEYTNFNGWTDEHERVFQEFIKRHDNK